MNNETRFFQIPFIPIPPSFYDKGNGLDAAAMAVWGALARWVTDSDGHCWRPIRLLAEDTKLSERSVRRAIKTLKKAGFLRVTLHRGAHSEYCLIWRTTEESGVTQTSLLTRGSDVVSMQTTEESGVTQTSLLTRGSDVVSMQTTEESGVTQTSLLKRGGLDVLAVKSLQQREKDGKWGHTDLTSKVTQAADLYLVSRKEKDSSLFSLGQVGKTEVTQDKQHANQKPDPPSFDWTCSFKKHWQTDQEVKPWLRRRHPDRNVDTVIEQTEVQLQANGAKPIRCGLSFLDYCCEYPFERVGTGWETTAEFINQLWRRVHQAKRHMKKPGGDV